MSDYQRIEYIKEIYNFRSDRSLALDIGANVQTFYDIKAGKCKISHEIAEKIQDKFKNVNKKWILTGEGEMLRNEQKSGDVETNRTDGFGTIPLLPISAQGGTLNDFVMSVHETDCESVVSPIAGADFAIPISGDSMAPEYPSGSTVLVKKINESAFIEWGKTYVLDTCNGTVIKKIMPTEDKMVVKCVSNNTDYPPFEVGFSDIYGMYRVMMCMSIK